MIMIMIMIMIIIMMVMNIIVTIITITIPITRTKLNDDEIENNGKQYTPPKPIRKPLFSSHAHWTGAVASSMSTMGKQLNKLSS
jgi:hypothetical protein